MSMQLTPEQEQRIRTVVDAGAYRSAEEALDATLDFEGTQEKLEELLPEGLDSGEPVEADEGFWNRLTAKTDAIATEHQARKTRP